MVLQSFSVQITEEITKNNHCKIVSSAGIMKVSTRSQIMTNPENEQNCDIDQENPDGCFLTIEFQGKKTEIKISQDDTENFSDTVENSWREAPESMQFMHA